jgi:hypothetical protein
MYYTTRSGEPPGLNTKELHKSYRDSPRSPQGGEAEFSDLSNSPNFASNSIYQIGLNPSSKFIHYQMALTRYLSLPPNRSGVRSDN